MVDRAVVLIRAWLAVIGIILITIALSAGRLGISDTFFGSKHVALLLSGLGVLIVSCALRLKIVENWLAGRARAVTILLVWLVILSAGWAGGELYARRTQDYLWYHGSLKKCPFSELDRMVVYNRRYYDRNRARFRQWPIPLELFDADKPTPVYLFKPNLRMARQDNRLKPASPGEAVYWSSNSWGFRGPECSVKKRQEVIRMVCLGASTTEGSGGDQETYPYFLQQELTRLFPNRAVEVINAGHHGHAIDDLLEILRQRVLPLHPDIVLFYEAANNAAPSWREFTHIEEMLFNTGYGWLYSYSRWYRWLYRHSALFTLFSDRLGWNGRKLSPMPHKFDETSPKPSAIHYKEVLRRMVREIMEHGSVVVLSSFITLAHDGLEVSYQETPRLFDELYRSWHPFTPGEIGRIHQYFNRQSADVAREFDVPYADVAAEFPRDIRYFPFDLIHFNAEGNRLLARLFAQFLAQEVLPGILHLPTNNRGKSSAGAGDLAGVAASPARGSITN